MHIEIVLYSIYDNFLFLIKTCMNYIRKKNPILILSFQLFIRLYTVKQKVIKYENNMKY